MLQAHCIYPAITAFHSLISASGTTPSSQSPSTRIQGQHLGGRQQAQTAGHRRFKAAGRFGRASGRRAPLWHPRPAPPTDCAWPSPAPKPAQQWQPQGTECPPSASTSAVSATQPAHFGAGDAYPDCPGSPAPLAITPVADEGVGEFASCTPEQDLTSFETGPSTCTATQFHGEVALLATTMPSVVRQPPAEPLAASVTYSGHCPGSVSLFGQPQSHSWAPNHFLFPVVHGPAML